MRPLKFREANTNLFPQISKGKPVFDPESGLIPAYKNQETGVTSIYLELTVEELAMLNKTKGKFLLTFNQQHNIASIQDTIEAHPDDLVESDEKTENPLKNSISDY